MHVLLFLACVGLCIVFPRTFRFAVGGIVGLAAGGMGWAIMAMLLPELVALRAFVAFIVVGSTTCATLALRS